MNSLVDFGKQLVHSFNFLIPLVPYFFKCLGLYLGLLRFVHETELSATDIMDVLDLVKSVGHFFSDNFLLPFYGFSCVFGLFLLVEFSDSLFKLAQHINK